MNLPTRMPCLGGVTSEECSSRAPRARYHFLRAGLSLSTCVAGICVLVACGIQAPPQPPRIEQPQQVKDLQAVQTGKTIRLTFTRPVLATDGERLDKPVELELFRTIAPAGQNPQPPDTHADPWITILPHDIADYSQGPKIVYPFHLTAQDIQQRQGATYAFSVVVLTGGFRKHPHKGEPSDVAEAKIVNVAEPPQNLSVTPSQTELRLTWSRPGRSLAGGAPSNLSGYRVYVSQTGKTNSFQLLAQTSSNQYDDVTFQFGQQYFFYVSAVSTMDGAQAESDPSPAVTIKPRDVFPPAVPQGLTAVYTAGAIDLLWNANTDADLAGYNVYKKLDDKPFERVNPQLLPTPIFHDTAVAADKSYQYAVTAVDSAGNESEKSETASISTGQPTGH